MADKKTEELAKQEPNAIAKSPVAGMDFITSQRPEDDNEVSGMEHVGKDDIAMPRLALMQKTSKEIEKGDIKFIEGAELMDMIHSSDKRNYKQGPVYFSVLRAYPPRWMQFRPIEEGGGIIDKDVRPGDPRTKFTQEDGKSVKPIATEFWDFIIMVWNEFDVNDPMKNVMALSFKSTGIKAAKELNKLILFRGKVERFKGVYRVTSDKDSKNGNTFAIYKVANNGFLTEGTPQYKAAEELFHALKGKEVEIDRDASDDVPFESEGQQNEVHADM